MPTGDREVPLVLFGLGGNLGNPAVGIQEAVRRLGAELSLERASSLYRTAPVDAEGQPDYLNAVVLARSDRSPRELLTLAHEVEREMGRERTGRNAARTIDIDLLAVGDAAIDEPGLNVPHPRMHRRAFVLVPLTEIHPDWMHPTLRKTARELLEELPDPGAAHRIGPLAV